MLMPRSSRIADRISAGLSAVLAAGLIAGCSGTGARTVAVNPVETDEVLVNPGKGFTTFYSFNGDQINQDHPLCSIVYYRWYWDTVEPEEGRIAFGMIDSILAIAHEKGQKLAFRVMCQNGHETADKTVDDRMEVPRWYRDSGAPGFYYPDKVRWMPDYDSEAFFEKHGRLIRALGGRYDGHPDLDHVDIGSIGHWGEWHTEGLNYQHMPYVENQKRMIDIYLESFRKTPLVMQVDAHEALVYAVSKGTGVRADCAGDMTEGRFFEKDGSPTNHMKIRYPRAFELEGVGESWKTAPIVFETCGNMQWWYNEGWDVDWIFNQLLEWHASVLNNKSFSVPPEWWPKVLEFQKKMGYRFVLRKLEYPSAVKAGGNLTLTMDWENKGVAPCYLAHPLAFQLRNADSGETVELNTGIDITHWLPGLHQEEVSITLPDNLEQGDYALRLALLDPYSRLPRIKFAIEGRDEDGWYSLGKISVR
ncbi:MAG TPA: DUF4832 domain-containing protein [archaeon]|nr:DUF4832 domain-containing protein [archaeon]